MRQRQVHTTAGLVEGIAREDCCEFRGIPYAAAPTGEARFLPPQPHPGWSGVRLAQAFAAAAPQEPSPVMGVDRIDDDCLFLNVVTPAVDGARRPVLVWLHGGGFLSGCGHQALYNGRALATGQDCVVVTCNYRLGLFGFADFAGVLGGDFPAARNVGLLDQLAVLHWVRDNIAGFGGNPDCVTVFGESAGGMSVATLLAMPAARGLFQRAIVQSGGADFVVAPDQARQTTQVALEALAPTRAAQKDALLRGEVRAIVRAQREAVKITVDRGLRAGQTPQFGMTLLPVVDGDLLPQRPLDALADGSALDIPLLASVTRDEWNLFVHQPQFAGGRNEKAEQMDEARLAHVFGRALPGRAAEALALYAQANGRQDNGMRVDRLCWMESDRMFRMPTRHLLVAHAARGRAAYAAQFEWACPQFGGRLGACHVVDVPFVFGVTGTPVGQFFTGGGAAAAALAQQVMASWVAFARDGVPAAINGEPFRAVRGDAVEAVRIGPVPGSTPLAGAAALDFWSFMGPARRPGAVA
jgi:para-nitrobenzyl esterase